MTKLSVVIITYNEATRIKTCLESVRWANEIIVVDAGSDDNTVDICRRYTDQVIINRDWPGFGLQKSLALTYATGDWVLSLDADEQVPAALQREIAAVLANPKPIAEVYELPRRSSFCGRVIAHSAWWPDYVARLFKRNAAKFSADLVHERLLYPGQAARLQTPLYHDSTPTIESSLSKMNRYSSAGAAHLFDQQKRAGIATAIGHGLWTFIRTYLFKQGYLDGREGFLIALANAESSFYKYIKLYYLHQQAAHRQQEQ